MSAIEVDIPRLGLRKLGQAVTKVTSWFNKMNAVVKWMERARGPFGSPPQALCDFEYQKGTFTLLILLSRNSEFMLIARLAACDWVQASINSCQ